MVENAQEKRSVGWLIASVILLVLVIIGLLNLLVIELVVVPKFIPLLNDLSVSLPVLTQLVMNASVRSVIAVLVIVFSVVLIVKEVKIKQKKKCFFVNLIFFVLTWVIIFVHAMALFLPIFQMAKGIQ